jgi:hypothetical protein
MCTQLYDNLTDLSDGGIFAALDSNPRMNCDLDQKCSLGSNPQMN